MMTAFAPQTHFETKNMLWLEITNFCNLQCSHCYNESGPSEPLEPSLSPDQYRAILSEARAMQFARVQFIGGEPLFYPHLQALVEYAGELGFEEIEIFSNLTTAPAWLLSPASQHLKIATSFYSDDPAVHDAITATPGSFGRTVANIRKVVAAGLSLRAGFIEMEANAGQFDRAAAFLRSLGVADVGFDAARQFGRQGQGAPSMSELCGHCSAGNLSVDAAGRVSGCIMSKPWAFGMVQGSTLNDLFHSADRRQFARELRRVVEERAPPGPVMCDPYDRGNCQPQCAPSCYPSQNCNPSTGNPCNPNGTCSPWR